MRKKKRERKTAIRKKSKLSIKNTSKRLRNEEY